jgi:hypothetical protein
MHPAVPSVSAPPPPVLIGNEWTSCSVQVDAFVGMPRMDETPRLFHRHGRHVLPMDLRSTRIALEAAGGQIRAECTELGSIKR